MYQKAFCITFRFVMSKHDFTMTILIDKATFPKRFCLRFTEESANDFSK